MAKKVTIKKLNKITQDSINADDWVNKREGIKRLTFDVPLSMHSQLKIHSVKTGKTMGDIVRECIANHLQEACVALGDE